MSIISQETFDKFTEEEKEIVRKYYSESINLAKNGIIEEERIGNYYLKTRFENLFGKENLQSKIKTWRDVEEYFTDIDLELGDIIESSINYSHCSIQLISKCIATLKISKLIELGYGGIMTEEEWENTEFKKYGIICKPYNKELFIKDIWSEQCFISFHTKHQAEEFMSYPENLELVKQYFMI